MLETRILETLDRLEAKVAAMLEEMARAIGGLGRRWFPTPAFMTILRQRERVAVRP